MIALEELPYRDGDVALTGLLACPAHKPRAAVVVYPTIMNPTPAVRDKAGALAEAGYLTLIADYYGARPGGIDQARELAAEIRPAPQIYRQRLRAAVRALVSLSATDGLPLAVPGNGAIQYDASADRQSWAAMHSLFDEILGA